MISISDAKDMVRPILEAVARSRKLVFYSEAWRLAGLNPKARRYMGQIFGELSEEEVAKGHPPISAIVIRKLTGEPGGGFFGLSCTPSALERHGKMPDRQATYRRR